jgi:hypothetical protein
MRVSEVWAALVGVQGVQALVGAQGVEVLVEGWEEVE